MKTTRKLLALVVAVVMIMAMASTAMAAEHASGGSGEATITVNNAQGGNTYKIYKVFNATVSEKETEGKSDGIIYTLVSGKTTAPAGFTADSATNQVKYIGSSTDGSLTEADIAAIAEYVKSDTPVEVTTDATETSFTVTGLDYGYYYITTTTGSLVTITSTNPTATVNDKNTAPVLNKTITNTDKTASGMAGTIDTDGKKALAELGREVEFTATITVGDGAQNYEFHDKMGAGLTFKGNDSVTVEANSALTDGWYTIQPTPDTGDTLTISFKDGIAKDTVITIKYIGTVNSDALTVDTGKNTASVTYGDVNNINQTPASTTNVYNAKFTVTKHDGAGAGLANAGFVIKNTSGAYYKFTAGAADGSTGATVTWYTLPDGETLAQAIEAGHVTEYKSNAAGAVTAFTGLANGTYTLVESTVPAGYNKAADSTFTIDANNYTEDNLAQGTTVVNNQGTVLPGTGGIGTTIFYALGGILVVGAVILLVTKRRMNANA